MRPPNLLPIFGESPHSYQLAEDMIVGQNGVMVQLPCGLIVDGASVPRPLWWLYPPDGLYRLGTVVHDYLYQTLGLSRTREFPLSRSQSDGIFQGILLRTPGLESMTANIMHLGVRLGGWLPWKRSSGIPRIEPLRYQIS